MLTRIYIDNFRCFVNFEHKPTARELIMGGNGSGKSSFIEAVLFVKELVTTADGLSPLVLAQRTRWLRQSQQTFEIDAEIDGNKYSYRVRIDSWGEPARPRIVLETLHFEGRPIFEFVEGEVRLYNDRFEHKVSYEFDWHRSALRTIVRRRDNLWLSRFKDWLGAVYCFRLNPFAMSPRAEVESLVPAANLSNIAAWYRHLVQANPRRSAELLESLRRTIEDFDFLQLDSAGENIRLLSAEFQSSEGSTTVKLGFDELSDGQRCLICLYTIIHFVISQGLTVLIDEPDNFLSLREIQPWLSAASDLIDESGGQLLLVSHHPEAINQWAPDSGVQFVREGIGPVRVLRFTGDDSGCLDPSELVARGWDRE